MKKSYMYYSDPGHGWLRVPLLHLMLLGLENMISSFSFKNDKYAYLEEDVDMLLFLKTAQERGWVVGLTTKNSNSFSKIRNMNRY